MAAEYEYDRLSYSTALLAVFLSSVIQGALFALAYVLGIWLGLIPELMLGILIGALLLRFCLSPFGWTISLKAAALCRLVCGFLSGFIVAFVFGVLIAASRSPTDHRVLVLGPLVFLAASVLELLTSAWAITFFAERLEEPDVRSQWTPPPSPGRYDPLPIGAPGGDAATYSHEDFMADLARARRASPSA